MTQNSLGRKVFIWLMLPAQSPSYREHWAGTQAGEERNEAKALEDAAYWLALFLVQLGDHLTMGGTTRTVSWIFPHQLLIMEKCSRNMPASQSDGGIFSVLGAFSPDNPSLCQVDRV